MTNTKKVDRIDRMFIEQKKFNKHFVNFEKLNSKERVQWTKEYVLHILSECDELLKETNWKIHRKEAADNVIISNIHEEIIDLFKYVMSISLIWNIDSEIFFKEFIRKTEVVEQRFKQEFELKSIKAESIVGVDIDGVLADYPYSFMQFVNKTLNKNITRDKLISYDLKKCLELSTEEYIRMKDEYRQCGEKRFIPLIDGAKEFLEFLKNSGYTVILLTARPYKRYKRIFADTQEWLKKNKLKYDSIIWDEEKDERLIREFGKSKICFFVEDTLSNANKISDLGTKVYLLNKTYNSGDTGKNVIRVNSLKEIVEKEKNNKVLQKC